MSRGKWWSHRECDDHPDDACEPCALWRRGEREGAERLAAEFEGWARESRRIAGH